VTPGVLVLAPPGALAAPPGARLVACQGAREVAAALAVGREPAVLLSDGLDEAGQQTVAAAVRASGRPVVEVRGVRWDGETQSPLSAACRGVISGFGNAGVAAAVALIEREAAG